MSRLAQYSVTTLRLGTMIVDATALTFGTGAGTRVEIPVWGAALQQGATRILVDTGLADAERWNRLFPCTIAPTESLDVVLAELGWTYGDVDVVVNSHLHFDHAGNNTRFVNAEFIVSAAEWEHAYRPVATQAWSYEYEWTDEAVTYMNYRLIGTDHYDIRPGLRVISTPGHTPGHQSVLVHTGEGVLCVAGDAACMMDNFTRRLPPGVVTDVPDALASLRKIERFADRVLINHDPALRPFQSGGFPVLAEGLGISLIGAGSELRSH